MVETLQRLEKRFSDAETELNHDNPFQLLIATILSAQCTDARVNQVTPILFRRFATPAALAGADPGGGGVDHPIDRIFQEQSQEHSRLCEGDRGAFRGRGPREYGGAGDPAGGRSENGECGFGGAFGKPAIVVDTHVRRVSNRLKFTRSEDPDQIEIDLGNLIPEEEWTIGSHRILLHGRYLCLARRPRCLECPLFDLCPAETEKKEAEIRAKGRSRIDNTRGNRYNQAPRLVSEKSE
ncbi:MAG: endonuclease III [Candidatus Manganitrophus sp.]|nr:endonuclease III [Candidatus Manganitrophus sp.]